MYRNDQSSIRGLAALALVAWAGCVPAQSALYAPVHARTEARLGQRVAWHQGAAEVDQLLQAPLTAAHAARIALLNSATLQASFAALDLHGAALAQAARPHGPEADIELTQALGGSGEQGIELQVLQDLTSLLQLPGRRGMARAALDAGRWRVVAAAVDLAAAAQRDFYRALAATHVLAMQQTIVEAASASFDLAQRLHHAGNITDLAFAQEQAMLEQAQLDRSAAALAAAQARERLAATLGLPGEPRAWTLAGELPALPASASAPGALEAEAVARSLALEALRAEREAATRAVGLARLTGWMPGLGLGVSARREGEGWQLGPAVALSIPRFDLGQSERAAARARLHQVEQRYRARAIEVRAAARALGPRIAAMHERAAHLRDVVLPLRERIVAESVLQHNAMRVSPFELLVARQQQIQAARQYIETVRDFWLAQVDLDQLRAGGTPPAAASTMQDPASPAGRPDREH